MFGTVGAFRLRFALMASIAGLLGGMAVVAEPARAAGPDPILLVHGYRSGTSAFDWMLARWAQEGRTAVAIDLPGEDNIVNARAIRDFIAARGWTSVDLVGVSMGGLSARWYTNQLRSSRLVDAYVSLGTPHYGLWAACLLPSWYGGQMCPRSTFLRDLNRGDDTKGEVAYTTIFSTDDGVVPSSAARLDGGACFVKVSGVAHNDLDNNEVVFQHVRSAVDGACTGSYTTL